MADRSCPHYKRLYHDMRYSDIAEDFCLISESSIPRLGLLYNNCNYDNHRTCPRYLAHQRRMELLEKEREEIVNSISFGD